MKKPACRLARAFTRTSRILVSVALAVIATDAPVATVVHSAYDSQENRVPAARIIVAVAATIVAFIAVVVAVRAAWRDRPRVWKLGAIWIATVMLLVLELVIELARGRP